MPPTTASDRDEIALRFLGKRDDFPAYFALYETLVTRANAHVVRVDPGGFGGSEPLGAGGGGSGGGAGEPGTPSSPTVQSSLPPRPPSLSPEHYHQSVLYTAELLKTHPDWTQRVALETLAERRLFGARDVRGVVDVAVQAMLMLDCAASERHSTTFVLGGYRPTSWVLDESFLRFVERSFPPAVQLDAGEPELVVVMAELKSKLKGWKLKKRLGITFRATDNLAEHLLFDPRYNVLYLFHHAAFLKAHLQRYAKELDLACTFEESLPLGTLPPQLLVEALHSLQSIIFAPTDAKSAALLSQLIKRRGFDPDLCQYDGYKRFRDPPDGFGYVYFGERMAKLNDLLSGQNRVQQPRSRFERWIQWQTTDSNALIVALLALVITIVLGVLTLVLSCVQTWIAYQAWKFPVNGNGPLHRRPEERMDCPCKAADGWG